MNSGKGENGSESSNSRALKTRVPAASIAKELDQLPSAGPVEQKAPDVVQRRRDRLARLLIRIRRGEAGYDVAKQFLHENEGLPPGTEV
jgi:hypothetical protein